MSSEVQLRREFEAAILDAVRKRIFRSDPIHAPLRFAVMDVWLEGRYPDTTIKFRVHPHGRPFDIEVVSNGVWDRHVGWEADRSYPTDAAGLAAEILLDVEDTWTAAGDR